MTGQGTIGTRIVVTGANGSAGKNLLAHATTDGDVAVVAVVRSGYEQAGSVTL